MFIIEGADCLGKTTAAKKMVEINKGAVPWTGESPVVEYEHMGRPDEATFDFFNDYTPMMHSLSVQDRFHLGGIIWHEGKISAASLKIIEGRLLARGAFIVIMYCSDYRWYMNKLENDERGNLFDPVRIAEANQEYKSMACGNHPLQPYIDDVWDIKQPDGGIQYPSDKVLKSWYSQWIERISKLC